MSFGRYGKKNTYLLSLTERNQSMLKQPRKSVMQPPQVRDVVLIRENLPEVNGKWVELAS